MLNQYDIRHTIVVFGGTRIQEPAAASRKVDQLRTSLAVEPTNGAIAQRLAVAVAQSANSRYYNIAREFGMRLQYGPISRRGG